MSTRVFLTPSSSSSLFMCSAMNRTPSIAASTSVSPLTLTLCPNSEPSGSAAVLHAPRANVSPENDLLQCFLRNLSRRLERPGRRMSRKTGSWCRKTRCTQAGMWCVDGERWWTFSTHTLVTMEKVTSTMVNIRYLPMSGTASEVGGTILEISKRKTVRARSTEMHRVIFSPQSDGK